MSTSSDLMPRVAQRTRQKASLTAAFNAISDGILVHDSDGMLVYWNPSAARLLGLQLRGDSTGVEPAWPLQLRDGSLLESDEHPACVTLRTGVSLRDVILEVQHPGEQRCTLSATTSLIAADGVIEGVVTTLIDISARREAELQFEAAVLKQSRFEAILEATPDMVAVSTLAGNIPYLNRAGRRMLGLHEGEEVCFDGFFTESARDIIRAEAIPAAMECGFWCGEVSLRRRSGAELAVSQVILAHRDSKGDVEFLSTIVRDISERKAAEESLKRMSLHDQLTGLYNRHGFYMRAHRALNEAWKGAGHCILVYMDVNDFKPINDARGHQVGDVALQEVAEILRETFRDSDILGRIGGDEFVALALNCLDESGRVLLQRLDERLAAHNAREGRQYHLSLGRGLTRFVPSDPKSLVQLLEEADRRQYEDKRVRKAARAASSADASFAESD